MMRDETPGWTHPLPAGHVPLRDPAGLSAAEAARRLTAFGRNAIVPESGSGMAALLRGALADPMLWFLLGTSALFGALGDRVEALVLLLAIVPLFGMDAFLHGRVQMRTAALSARLAAFAEVIRDGRAQRIAAGELVPGDRLKLTAGDPIPVDAILLDGDGVQVDESTLTGESLPVRKQPLPSTFAAAAVPHLHWIGAGARVLTGSVTAEVIQTGADTSYGALARAAAEVGRGATPLQQSLRKLVGVLLVAALVLCVLLAAVRLWQGHGLVDALLAAVVLAVAALPEEFPLVFASVLGVGVYRLARRHALVRRAVAVEALGRVSCICTDKTGTLTEGRVMLAHVVTADDIDEARLLRAAAIASNVEANDPVDVAVLARTGSQPSVARFPFTEARRREVAVAAVEGGFLAALKGAPETVFALSGLAADGGAEWRDRLDALAADGHKVLAIGERRIDDPAIEPQDGFTLLGLLAFEDPLRPGVRDAVIAARAAGIRVIIVTGDHPATARAIAVELGLGEGDPSVAIGDAVDPAAPPDVVARSLPTQKLALVQALQARGERVAVTGDGINDVPALRGADVGIAMGERGTAAARDAAAIILLDDAFDTIVAAVAEGRQLFTNLRASVAFLLLAHIPLVLTAALLPLAGYPLPYPPVVIVWLELLIHPLAFLGFQQAVGARMPPLLPGEAQFFDRRQWIAILLLGGIATVTIGLQFAGAFGTGPGEAGDVAAARSAALGLLAAVIVGSAAGLSRLHGRSAIAVVVAGVLALIATLGWSPLAALIGVQPMRGAGIAWIAGGFVAAWIAGHALASTLQPQRSPRAALSAP